MSPQSLYRRLAALIGLAVAAAVCASCDGSPAGGAPHSSSSPVVVETIALEPSELPRLLTAVGTLESPYSTMIAAEASGVVTFLDLPEGAEVEVGRVLARIDSRQEKAQLVVARSRVANAKATYERIRSLHQKNLVSHQELDDAAAALDQARGELEESKTSLNQTEVRAPFTGQLGLRDISVGAYVDQGDPLVRLTQVDPLRLVFTVPERDAGRVRVGQKIRGVAGDCTLEFESEIAVIDPSIDPSTRTVRVQARVRNPERLLRAGMSARLALEIGRSQRALSVPQEAVVRRGTRQLLFVLAADGKAEEREVVLGQHFPDRIEVVSGVQAGERVIVTGHQRLRPGSVTDPRPYEPVENPKLSLGFPHLPACTL